MIDEERADFLNDLEEFVEKYNLHVGGYEDQDEEHRMITIVLIR